MVVHSRNIVVTMERNVVLKKPFIIWGLSLSLTTIGHVFRCNQVVVPLYSFPFFLWTSGRVEKGASLLFMSQPAEEDEEETAHDEDGHAVPRSPPLG